MWGGSLTALSKVSSIYNVEGGYQVLIDSDSMFLCPGPKRKEKSLGMGMNFLSTNTAKEGKLHLQITTEIKLPVELPFRLPPNSLKIYPCSGLVAILEPF